MVCSLPVIKKINILSSLVDVCLSSFFSLAYMGGAKWKGRRHRCSRHRQQHQCHWPRRRRLWRLVRINNGTSACRSHALSMLCLMGLVDVCRFMRLARARAGSKMNAHLHKLQPQPKSPTPTRTHTNMFVRHRSKRGEQFKQMRWICCYSVIKSYYWIISNIYNNVHLFSVRDNPPITDGLAW